MLSLLNFVLLALLLGHFTSMAGDKMDIELAEERLRALDHSEQHYFNRFVYRSPCFRS